MANTSDLLSRLMPTRKGWCRATTPKSPYRRGLRYVCTGNVHDSEGGGGPTVPAVAAPVVVERDWYVIGRYQLTDDDHCTSCGTAIPGRYDGPVGRWGGRRVPVSMTGRGS